MGESADPPAAPNFDPEKMVGRHWYIVAATPHDPHIEDQAKFGLTRKRNYHENWKKVGPNHVQITFWWQDSDAADAPWSSQPLPAVRNPTVKYEFFGGQKNVTFYQGEF